MRPHLAHALPRRTTRRPRAVVVALALVAGLLGVAQQATPAAAASLGAGTILTPGNKCLDVKDGASFNGNEIRLWDCNGAPAQDWSIESDGSVRAVGRCLDVPGNSVANGTRVQLWECNGSPFQKWVLGPDGSFLNPNSGRCLDSAGGNPGLGTRAQIYDCLPNNPAQLFLAPSGTGSSLYIVGQDRKCLDIQTADLNANGQKVGVFDCNWKPWQRWATTGDGAVHALGRCLSVPGGSTAQGTGLEMSDCTGGPGQKWEFRADGSIYNPNSRQCVDIPNGNSANGTQVRLWECNGATPQKWRAPSRIGAATVDVDASTLGTQVPSTLHGYLLEDISNSVDGGIYGELLRNRTLKESDTATPAWSVVTSGGGTGSIALDRSNALNSAIDRSLRVQVAGAGPTARVGAANGGYYGIHVTPSTTYTVSFWAKASAGLSAPLTVSLEGTNGTAYATAQVGAPGTGWKRFAATLKTPASAPDTGAARLAVYAGGCGASCPQVNDQTLWLSVVSLFPPTFKGRANGARPDLAGLLADANPGVLRVPGGNYLQGKTYDTRFAWKRTLGPIETRPGHDNDGWGYWSNDGMGILEYLELAEDIGAQPLLAVYGGFPLLGTPVPENQLQPYIQEALDEIEYAIGDTSTTWGARRAADGHPAPFDVRWVEVGNEDFFDTSGSYENYRFPNFYDAIKAKYPQLQVIATQRTEKRKSDITDDHFYPNSPWFAANAHRYDAPSTPKTIVGEYGTIDGRPTPVLGAAIGEAAFLTGVERNSDRVLGSLYAPLLVNENNIDWETNMIGFDATHAYGSPSYWVAQVFGTNVGDRVVPSTPSGTGPELYTSATVTTSGTKKVFVKLVNFEDVPRSTTVNVGGITGLGSAAQLTTVSDTNPRLRNTLASAPVKPKTSTIPVAAGSTTVTLPANSASVAVFTVGGTTPTPNFSLLAAPDGSHTNGKALAGSTVASPLFAWVPEAGVKSVAFSVDGTAVRTEATAAFDLGGTATSGAGLPYALGNGSHTVRAVVTPVTGAPVTLTATFTVTGGQSGAFSLLAAPTGSHTSGRALAGSTLGSPVYVWVPEAGVASVVFSVDGKQVRTEAQAAFDLGGTAGSGAGLPYALATGAHTVRAVVTPNTGTPQTLDASFTVR